MDRFYFFSSPEGDIPLSADDLQQPFLLADGAPHATLRLTHYFHALEQFILQDGLPVLAAAGFPSLPEYGKMILRSEKHGKLYHIASVEFIGARGREKFAISTALSEQGIACLARDAGLMRDLSDRFGGAFLPTQYLARQTDIHAAGDVVPVCLTLCQWFEGFHEWHLSSDPARRQDAICLWDYHAGNTYLEQAQGLLIFEKAAAILTHYFEPESGRQIYPWHHAAGDFIVRQGDDGLEVRLITVRDYLPLAALSEEASQASSLANWMLFLLHLSIRMRLDKRDGVAETVWLDDAVVAPVVRGVLQGYEARGAAQGGMPVADFVRVLHSFGPAELAGMAMVLLERYAEDSEADMQVIGANIDRHWPLVCQALASFS